VFTCQLKLPIFTSSKTPFINPNQSINYKKLIEQLL
jgi:hypothetical protein